MGADRAFKQILGCAVLLIIICVVSRLTIDNSYTVYIPMPLSEQEKSSKEDLTIEVAEPSVAGYQDPRLKGGYLRVPIKPGQAGETLITIRDVKGNNIGSRMLRVGPLGTVYDVSAGGFTGDRTVLIAIPVFCFLVCAIMLWHFFQAKGPSFYRYATIHYAGFSLFALICGVVILIAAIRHFVNPRRYTIFVTYRAIRSMSRQFVMLTMPLMVAFAISLIVCNIALLRYEKPRLQNVLGILIGALLIAGEAFGWYLFTRSYTISEMMGRMLETAQNTYAVVFAYFECMLVGSVICGVMAAKRRVSLDRDFIVILGCWFRKDGSLPPLLKGRVDRAIAFWRQQKEESGREAIMIPSGGQGPDECMPEAQAMRRYLLEQGIPEDRIIPEEHSANTYQNMSFSGEIIREQEPEGKVVFATTNYHVFRSGIWAGLAGLPAEGIGSRTKWWFWPNAFMREVIGLFANRWKQELLFLILLVAFFGTLSVLLW